MKLHAYLMFNGQCATAFQFYEKCLGGKITFMMAYGDSPMAEQASASWREKIMHATLTFGDQTLSGADALPEQYQKPQGFSMTLNLSDTAEADRIFQALKEGGTVQVPFQETFWALRFGMVVDRFGMPWLINCEKPAVDNIA